MDHAALQPRLTIHGYLTVCPMTERMGKPFATNLMAFQRQICSSGLDGPGLRGFPSRLDSHPYQGQQSKYQCACPPRASALPCWYFSGGWYICYTSGACDIRNMEIRDMPLRLQQLCSGQIMEQQLSCSINERHFMVSRRYSGRSTKIDLSDVDVFPASVRSLTS